MKQWLEGDAFTEWMIIMHILEYATNNLPFSMEARISLDPGNIGSWWISSELLLGNALSQSSIFFQRYPFCPPESSPHSMAGYCSCVKARPLSLMEENSESPWKLQRPWGICCDLFQVYCS